MTLTSTAQRIGDAAVLRAAGRIDSEDLDHWTGALEVAGMLGSGPILIDLAGVETWSTSAQYAVLRAAQRAARHGRELILCRPNPRLRSSCLLPVFDQLTSSPDDADTLAARLGRQPPPPVLAGTVRP